MIIPRDFENDSPSQNVFNGNLMSKRKIRTIIRQILLNSSVDNYRFYRRGARSNDKFNSNFTKRN